MKQLKYISVFIMLALAGFFLQSCGRDKDCGTPKTEICPIEPGLRAEIPYSGYDTLTFVRTSVGDTHVFIGINPMEGYDLTTATSYSEDCPPDNAKMGHLIYTFNSSTFPSKIIFDVYYLRYGEIPYVAINFNNQIFERKSSLLGAPYSYDSVLVGGRFFYNIDRISSSEKPVTDEFFVWYNTTWGMLKFKFKNGEEWELLSRK